jgi:hypothetical protein
MMPTIELIYDSTCPNVPAARQRLTEVLSALGISERWREWERSSPEAPAYALNYGSPTILVDGEDVAGATGDVGRGACRVYVDPESGRFGGVPSANSLRAVIERRRA